MKNGKVFGKRLPNGCNQMENVTIKVETKLSYIDGIPKPLIGGTSVYQKIGLPYWFCRIKNGRDEFMFLNTEDLIKNDLLYDSKTGEERDFSKMTEKEFMKNVLKALENKQEDGGVWIPICEPSSDKDGRIQFVKGQRPLVSMNLNRIKWKLLLTKYSPENYSKMLSIHTWFLLGLRFIKDGIATADQLANDSTGLGHYYDRSEKDYVCGVEKAGKREY